MRWMTSRIQALEMRLSRDWGWCAEQGMMGWVFHRLGIKDGVGLVETGVDGSSRSVDVLTIR